MISGLVYQLFDFIDRNGGYFLTRLRRNAIARIVEIIDKRLAEVAHKLKRASPAVKVEVEFKRRTYAGHRRLARRRLRLVGVRGKHSGTYWFYLTNIPVHVLEAELLAQVLACRWQIELVFKELKSHYRLDELLTRKARVVETLILSNIITLLASCRLLDALRRRLRREEHRDREGRWASKLAAVAISIIDLVLLPVCFAKALARRLETMLLQEAVDPNVSRLLLLQRVDQSVAWAH